MTLPLPDFEGIKADPDDPNDVVHTGGEVGDAAKTLADKDSTDAEREDASDQMNDHKENWHDDDSQTIPV